MPKSDVNDKLVAIADGDIDLVRKAIRATAAGRDTPPDLESIVRYILKHRRGQVNGAVETHTPTPTRRRKVA